MYNILNRTKKSSHFKVPLHPENITNVKNIYVKFRHRPVWDFYSMATLSQHIADAALKCVILNVKNIEHNLGTLVNMMRMSG